MNDTNENTAGGCRADIISEAIMWRNSYIWRWVGKTGARSSENALAISSNAATVKGPQSLPRMSPGLPLACSGQTSRSHRNWKTDPQQLGWKVTGRRRLKSPSQVWLRCSSGPRVPISLAISSARSTTCRLVMGFPLSLKESRS